jgi:hypothetical protein
MDMQSLLTEIIISAFAGGMCGAGLVVSFFTNARTKESALNGSPRQKLIAFSLRFAVAIMAYGVILASARAMYVYTNKTLVDALFFIGSSVGILLLARRKKNESGNAPSHCRSRF